MNTLSGGEFERIQKSDQLVESGKYWREKFLQQKKKFLQIIQKKKKKGGKEGSNWFSACLVRWW